MATESTILRDELKSWENQFKLDHDGRKPSRADIKSNIEIAAKYKRFNSLRCPDLVKQPVETPRKSSRKHNIPENALRERAPNAATTTPRGKTFKTLDNEDIQQPILSPVKEEQPTPAFIRNGLGPTPQRDGHVLGIFDLLPDGTPSKRSPSPSGEHGDAVNATPSKSSARLTDSAISRTPQSSSKRYFLDSFITTPGKRKREDEPGTPSSSKKLYATPSFLRRISMPMAPIDEDDNDTMLPPRRRKPISRSFSSLVQDLRNQEEERMDDEWDIMNELEAEEHGAQPPKKQAEQVQVADSQLVVMPLGPDQAPESESEEEVALGNNGLRKVYKKKGLKRQTRRANIKPVLNKPKRAADLEDKGGSDNDENDDEAVAETQVEGADTSNAGDAQGDGKGKDAEKSTNPIKRAAKKVSQNLQRLKINKNPNLKAKGKGRFGRR
jgi:DNA replication regulator SLD2